MPVIGAILTPEAAKKKWPGGSPEEGDAAGPQNEEGAPKRPFPGCDRALDQQPFG
jgi:hypothetical protein